MARGPRSGDAVTVLYRQGRIDREDPEDLVEGVGLVFEDFARTILGPGDHRLEDVLVEAILEIVEPHGLGRHLDVPWAHGLTAHPDEVFWSGFPSEDPRAAR